MRWRVLAGVAAVALMTLAAPGAAFGATVGHLAGDGRVDVMAAPGEVNQVTVGISGGDLVVVDRGPPGMTPAGDCTPGSDMQTVTCPAPGINLLVVYGGDQDDALTNTTAIAAQMYGEAGGDTVRGGSAGDQIEGGPGADTLDGGSGNDRLFAATVQDPGAGADADQLAGGPGDDQLFGGGGADRADAGAGADQLEGAGGKCPPGWRGARPPDRRRRR